MPWMAPLSQWQPSPALESLIQAVRAQYLYAGGAQAVRSSTFENENEQGYLWDWTRRTPLLLPLPLLPTLGTLRNAMLCCV